MRSAVERIKPEQAFLYFEYEPRGPFWELTKKLIKCIKITAPRAIFGKPLHHYAHRADVLRLEKLIALGGIYLDCDVVVHREFDDLLNNSVVIGQEGEDGKFGLCNAVILAEPGAPFLRKWYSAYKSFRSKGHDRFWIEHSIELPRRLAQAHPQEVTVVPARSFAWPTWEPDGIKRMFASSEPIVGEDAYANHLWENCASAYLRDLTPARVRAVDSNFHSWIRPFVADLPDELGSRSLAARLGSDLARQMTRDHFRKTAKSVYWKSRQTIRRVFPIVRHRHRAVDRVVGAAAVTAGGLGWPDNFITGLHRRRTFQSVYRHRLWGADGASVFFSGLGSRDEPARSYVEAMGPLLARHTSESATELVIVDLGCGDFVIGSALLEYLRGKGVRYIGCDLVPELIAYNQHKFGLDGVEFRALDIVGETLPDGDVCLLRQVLQHLSNAEIAAVLPRLKKYKYVYVSEGQPLTREGMPNPDKAVGAEVRFDWQTGVGRGVELDLPPWNLKLEEITRTQTGQDMKEIVVTHRLMSFISSR